MFVFHLFRGSALCLAVVVLSTISFSQVSLPVPVPAERGGFQIGFGTPDVSELPRSEFGDLTLPSTGPSLDPTLAPVLDNAFGFVNAIEQQANGKILVGGGFKSVNGYATSCMLRLNADRSIDTTFKASIRGQVGRIIVLPDDKILIVGPFSVYNSTTLRTGVARLNSDGSLDPTFDTGGFEGSLPRDVRLLADGKILIAGDFYGVNGTSRTGIAKLNADGSLDTGFTSPFQLQILPPTGAPPQTGVQTVGVQPDGKVIVGGFMQFAGDVGSTRRWVARLNSDGTVDGSFFIPSMTSNPSELDIQPDGKIVLVGFFTTINSTPRSRLARLNPDGTLDTTFDPGTGANATTSSARVLSSGKVLVTGSFSTINAAPRGGVALLNSDGTLDATLTPGTTTGTVNTALPTTAGGYYVGGSFSRIAGTDNRNTIAVLDSAGVVDPTFAATSYTVTTVRTIAVQPDGKIIAGGSFNRLNGATRTSLVRFNANGTPDLTFDSGQLTAVSVFRIVFQSDGKILVMGSNLVANGGAAKQIVRLNSDGTVDNTFSQATISQISFGLTAAVQQDGKIIFSYITTSPSPLSGSGLVRLNPDGSLDGSWNNGFPTSRIESLAVLANGQILAAGPFGFTYVTSLGGTSEPHNGIIRINPDGSHDRTFRSAFTSEGVNFTAAYAMHVQPDGKILIGGRLFSGGASSPVGVARLNPTGTLDGTFQTNILASYRGVAHVFSIHPTADGKLLAGGFFELYGGSPHECLVRLEASGAIDQTFTASADYAVNAITTGANGSILLGGSFEKVNGVARTAIARLTAGPSNRAPFDFDGDGKTDVGIFRAAGGEWWINQSGNGVTTAGQFGSSSDVIAPADFTGDGKTDIAFFRPSDGFWFVLRSEDYSYFALPFGASGDVPVPADFDGDGKADQTVFRPSSATWFIRRSSDGGATIAQFGSTGDVPVPADYDGDGKADFAIYRPSLGQWWINRSTAGLLAFTFGNSNDKPVQGDFTGDGKVDAAFWRPSTGEWFISRSEDLSYYSLPFGANGDVPAPGDYDGDGKFDPTVFRPSAATWFSQRSTAGIMIQQFGANGDRPIPNAFVP